MSSAASGPRLSRIRVSTSGIAIAPIGTLSQKIHSQSRPSTTAPPTSGPAATERPVIALKIPIAAPRRSGGKAALSSASPSGISSAAPTPCSARAAISQPTPGVAGQGWLAGPKPSLDANSRIAVRISCYKRAPTLLVGTSCGARPAYLRTHTCMARKLTIKFCSGDKYSDWTALRYPSFAASGRWPGQTINAILAQSFLLFGRSVGSSKAPSLKFAHWACLRQKNHNEHNTTSRRLALPHRSSALRKPYPMHHTRDSGMFRRYL